MSQGFEICLASLLLEYINSPLIGRDVALRQRGLARNPFNLSPLDSFSSRQQKPVIARRSRGDAVVIKKGMHIVLDCFANARNDGLISPDPQSRYRSPAPLAATSRVKKTKNLKFIFRFFIFF